MRLAKTNAADHEGLTVQVSFEQFCRGCTVILEIAVGGAVDLYLIIRSMFPYRHYEGFGYRLFGIPGLNFVKHIWHEMDAKGSPSTSC